MMMTQSKIILPYVLPYLTDHQPVNTRALALLAPVAGEALTRHLTRIIPAMILTLTKKLDSKNEKREIANCNAVILSANDQAGAQIVVEQLLLALKNSNQLTKRAALMIVRGLCHQATLSPLHVGQILYGLIMLYSEDNEQILGVAYDAINCLTMDMDSRACIEHIPDVRNAIRMSISALKMSRKEQKEELLLPGFKTAQGFLPLSIVYRESIINGPADKKELAANSLCEIMAYSSEAAVKASTMKIAGSVVRILSECIIKDRHPGSVKVALLETLILLITKVGVKIRPFIPLCELTFKKLSLDPHDLVRLRTGVALEMLAQVSGHKAGRK